MPAKTARSRPQASPAYDEASVLDRVAPHLAKLSEQELRQPNIEIAETVERVLHTVNAARPLAAELARLPGLDGDLIGRLLDSTLALRHYHARVEEFVFAPAPTVPPIKLGQHLRRKLQLTVELLSLYELMSDSVLTELSSGNSSAGVSADLKLLAAVLSKALPKIRNSCPLKDSDLAEARRIAAVLLNPDQERPELAEYEAARSARKRAFTLMLNTYGELRRGVCFLRPGADGDALVPALYRQAAMRGEHERHSRGARQSD
jgi:hypothetical protein